MKLEKLICATTIITSSVMITSLIQNDFISRRISKHILNMGVLKFQDSRTLIFFIFAQAFLFAYSSLKIAETLSSNRFRKKINRSSSELASSFFLTFTTIICAYIFKFNMEVLLSNTVFSLFSIYASAIFYIANSRIVSFFFLCCTLSSNALLISSVFLSNFSLLEMLEMLVFRFTDSSG